MGHYWTYSILSTPIRFCQFTQKQYETNLNATGNFFFQRIGAKPKIVALKKKLDELWPANRQMRADILREFILGKAGCKQLLFARGVVFEFDQARGDFHLPEHKSQRVKHKKQ